jgi:hypothetical protein
LAIITKIPSNSIPARVLIFFCRFAVIKLKVRCFETEKFSSYFCFENELREKGQAIVKAIIRQRLREAV